MNTRLILSVVLWIGGTTLMSLYYYHLRAPSVIEVRPELAEVSFGTALFSGRFMSWLWYNSPVAGTIAIAILTFLCCLPLLIPDN